MPHRPQAVNAVVQVKEVTPFILVVPFGTEGAVSLDSALNPSLEASAELRIAACVLYLGACYFQNVFCE